MSNATKESPLILDAELGSDSLEQRAAAAANEITSGTTTEGDGFARRSQQYQAIILRHFSGLGGGNGK